MTIDTMTVLRCFDGFWANKSFMPDEKGIIECYSYNAGTEFRHAKYPISSLEDIYTLISRIQNYRTFFIIRGEPIDGIPPWSLRKCNGIDATFFEKPRYWVMFDIDTMEYEEDLQLPYDTEKMVWKVKRSLPEEFWGPCVYQFSSKQNVPFRIGTAPKKQIRLHLFYWLEAPVSNREWKAYIAKKKLKIDPSPFSPVQPHFTARPSFTNMADPLSERLGIC